MKAFIVKWRFYGDEDWRDPEEVFALTPGRATRVYMDLIGMTPGNPLVEFSCEED